MRNRLIGSGIKAALFGLLFSQTAFAQSGAPGPLSTLAIQPPAAVQRSTGLGHMSPSQVLHVAISMPYADQAGIESYADSVSDPKSPNYRQFLTPEEVGARYGLPLSAVQGVTNYLQS